VLLTARALDPLQELSLLAVAGAREPLGFDRVRQFAAELPEQPKAFRQELFSMILSRLGDGIASSQEEWKLHPREFKGLAAPTLPRESKAMNEIKKVGFLGLGTMGGRMARNLAQKGFEVTVWNRTRAKAEELVRFGAKVADSPAQVAASADAFCTCLAGPPALREVVFGPQGLFSKARPGQLYIDFSTISPDLARELEAAASERGVQFVESPMTGSKVGAEKGTLLLMVGARPEALERALPIFRAVSEKSIHCGPVGSGSQVKLAGNALISMMLEGLSEGMLLTQKAGVDPRKLLEVIQSSGFRSPYYDFKGPAILKRDFEPHFSIDLMFKDLNLFLQNAADNRVPTPAVAAVKETYQLARAQGKGAQDVAAVVTALEDLCGVKIGT
jgi:3-hydroxyisobutyrate dehydrogenase-like beta-hydroxyacid dehydrogenase